VSAAERVNMLWIGPALGPVERACMRSVLRQGHKVTLWTYGHVDEVPDGVETADAGSVLPEAAIVRHKNGSPSLFSNRFRYALQRRGAGAWLDADVYLLRPLPEAPLLLALEDERWINPAVLRLPSDSPLLGPLLALFEERTVPFWLPPRARIAARWRLWRTGRSNLGLMPWGVAGPKALTALARRHGLAAQALPAEAFNPVHWSEAGWILDPAQGMEDRVGPGTIGLHLWNEKIKGFKDAPAPAGSFLARLQREGA
jgi:hypothetical protein